MICAICPLNERDTPNFLHAAPDMTACAAFIKESRMDFANAHKPLREIGDMGTPGSVEGTDGRTLLLRSRLILEQEKSAFAAHREIEISISIKVGDSDLDAAPGAAAIVDHMPGPIDRVSGRIKHPLIPIHSQWFAGTGIMPVMCQVSLSGQ